MPINTLELLNAITQQLDSDKIENIVTIDLKDKTAIADFMVIGSARSSKHASAAAEKLADHLEEIGLNGINMEGHKVGDWVLIDTGAIIVHIFKPEIREIYNIEKIWNF
jgi:ribosome-associated protein